MTDDASSQDLGPLSRKQVRAARREAHATQKQHHTQHGGKKGAGGKKGPGSKKGRKGR